MRWGVGCVGEGGGGKRYNNNLTATPFTFSFA